MNLGSTSPRLARSPTGHGDRSYASAMKQGESCEDETSGRRNWVESRSGSSMSGLWVSLGTKENQLEMRQLSRAPYFKTKVFP